MKILALDAFTNGHEAARAFIRRQGWLERECEIVFCRTHANLLQQLTTGPAFAVVPIYNSIAGEITEVTENLARLREHGHDLLARDQLDLQVNHCLLTPHHVHDVGELEYVMTYQKAFEQCREYLDRIGITPNLRLACDSTGEAARLVAISGPTSRVAAIASRAAAEAYGLRILADRIQDDPTNKTTFLLLKHEVVGHREGVRR